MKQLGIIRRIICLFLLLCSLLCISSCTKELASSQGETLHIVATTTLLADLTAVIGGEAVTVTALMGSGVDPHLYQASGGDVFRMQEADLVIYNGLHLEGKMGDVFSALGEQGKSVLCIADGLPVDQLLSDPSSPDYPDPHFWFDVSLWSQAASYLCASLEDLDPAHRDVYQSNLLVYQQELEELEAYIEGRTAELAEAQRVLITAHDAFRYFGQAYGFTVLGLQGISTDSEAGTADVMALADFIVQQEISAIFVETSISSKHMEALQDAVQAQGFTVGLGESLYSDSLGDASSGHDSYITTFQANIDRIVNGLKGEVDG